MRYSKAGVICSISARGKRTVGLLAVQAELAVRIQGVLDLAGCLGLVDRQRKVVRFGVGFRSNAEPADQEAVVAEVVVGFVNKDIEQHASQLLPEIFAEALAVRLQQVAQIHVARWLFTTRTLSEFHG